MRDHRRARKLTLEQLSVLAGVSKAMLSQIEQDNVNPTVAVMLKIAAALGISIGELLGDPDSNAIFRHISADDDAYTFRADKMCNIRTLSPLDLEKSMEFYRLTLEFEGELASESHFPGTEEVLHLSRGRLTVLCGKDRIEMRAGDSIHYRADLPHTLRNTGRGRAEAYMVVRYRTE